MKNEYSIGSEPPTRRLPADAHPDVEFLVKDLQRTFVRIAGNLRWYEQTWLGVPVWQLPDDLQALQRIVYDAQPTWIVETGTKFGGSAIFFASLLTMMGRTAGNPGGVITVDINETLQAKETLSTRPHKMAALVRHRLIGDAESPVILDAIRSCIASDPGSVMVFLDDCHEADHVSAELKAYSYLIRPGGILIAADTTFEDLADTPVVTTTRYSDPKHSNPRVAVRRFLAENSDFETIFDYTSRGISNFPDSVLRRVTRESC